MGLCEATLEGHQGEVLCMKMADSRNPRIVSGGGSTCKTIKGTKGPERGFPPPPLLTLLTPVSLSLFRSFVRSFFLSRGRSVEGLVQQPQQRDRETGSHIALPLWP